MHEQKKNFFMLKTNKISYKKKNKKKSSKHKRLKFFISNFTQFKILRLYKRLNSFLSPYESSGFNFLAILIIRANNIFCNLLGRSAVSQKFTTKKFLSCSSFKLTVSKRRLKFIVTRFLKFLKKGLTLYPYIFLIKGPIYLRRYIFKKLRQNLKVRLIIFDPLLIFNGCRSKKKRRKKHLKYRSLR